VAEEVAAVDFFQQLHTTGEFRDSVVAIARSYRACFAIHTFKPQSPDAGDAPASFALFLAPAAIQTEKSDIDIF
jgi:hypothetical protein